MIETERLLLRGPTDVEPAQLLHYHVENWAHLAPWSPTVGPEFFTEETHARSLELYTQEMRAGVALRLFLFLRSHPNEVIGTVSLTDIQRRSFQGCYLGYGLAERLQGKGVMREAVASVVDHAFAEMNLHRVMAQYMPRNRRSGALLRALNFVIDGYAREYLLINGVWEDHVMTSRVNHDWDPQR